MTDYWIKLYHEILDDPKMAMLPDGAWRLCIELFLLAGRLGKNGELPDVPKIAWCLRMSQDDIAENMNTLDKAGIISCTSSGWVVNKFAKRQAPTTDAERKRYQRQRAKKDEYYQEDDVTKRDTTCHENVTQLSKITYTDTDTDTELNNNKNDFQDFFKAYCQEMHLAETQVHPQKAVDAFEKIINAGATVEDMREGIRTLLNKGYVIASPASVINTTINTMSKRLALPPRDNGKKKEPAPDLKGYTYA